MVVRDERKRYIHINFMLEKPSKKNLNKMIRTTVAKLAGELFLARSGLMVLDFKANDYIVKCNHKSRDIVEAALSLISLKNNFVRIITVSGTIKSIDQSLVDDIADIL